MDSQDLIQASRIPLTSEAFCNILLTLFYTELMELAGFEKEALKPAKQP
jgi:hypothetical protein